MPGSLSLRIAKGIISGLHRVLRPEASIRFRPVPGCDETGSTASRDEQRLLRTEIWRIREKDSKLGLAPFFFSAEYCFFPA